MPENASAGVVEKTTFIDRLAQAKVLPDAAAVEERVRRIRAASPGLDNEALARRTVRSSTQKITGLGVTASLPGAIPGLGTAAQAGMLGTTIAAETWAVLRELSAMQLTVAGLFGHDTHDPARLDELVIVWGIQTGAIVPATEAGKRLGTRIVAGQINRHVSGAVLGKINRVLTTTVLTKQGTKRGGIALGRVVPFGAGVVIGGGMNWVTARGFGGALMRYYSELLPTNAEVVILD